MDCVPYTYLIGWSKTNMYYYGVRYAAYCHPNDLWKSYFTSSKHVKNYRDINGEPDIIQVRKTFIDPDKARLWEEKVLKKINASHRDDFLNKANGKAIPLELSVHIGEKNGMFGKKHSEQTIVKLKGPKKETTRKKMQGKRPFFKQNGSKNNAFKGFVITPYGKFNNLHEAAYAEEVNYSTIAYRINSESPKFKKYERVL